MKNPLQTLYEFTEFRLDPRRRMLMRRSEPVSLPPKVFDILLFLVQNSGRVLEKDELMKALWPDSFVEEGNLAQNIFALRKILGDDQNGRTFIQTIPRRGYKFVSPVRLLEVPAHAAESPLPAEYWRQHSPFRGLQVFEPDDAWLFFGRALETEELLLCLKRSPVLTVIGNSGCGKSSLIRAGLIPALHAGRFQHDDKPVTSWRIAIIRPGAAPFEYLAEILPSQLTPELSLKDQAEFVATCRSKLPLGGETLRDSVSALVNGVAQKSSGTRILLIVDQFEEIFTLTADYQIRGKYIDSLLAASREDGAAPLHVVLILRSDFYSHCLEHANLSRRLGNNLYNVPRITQDQLCEATEKRLVLAGAHAESGLIDSLLDDVGTEPGNLALMEQALSQLWEKCGGFGCTLTSEAYSRIGRLRGSLSAHADEVYSGITDTTQKQFVKKIFLELVHLGEDAPDTRRRVRKAELLSLGVPRQLESLLARLASNRLISISREAQDSFVEVSHEALIREWSTLRQWIAQDREELLLARRLLQAAHEWGSLKRDPGALLQGARLAQAEEWLTRNPVVPVPVRVFLQASIAARAEAEERELRKQRAAATRLRWFSCIVSCLLLVAVAATWFAHRQQLLAEARALAVQSEEMLERNQGRALDLALQGWNIARTQETYTALTKALPQTLCTLKHEDEIIFAGFSPDGEHILTASYDHTAKVWGADDGRLLITLQGHTNRVEDAAYSRDGQYIVTASDDHTAKIWNAGNGRLLVTLRGHTDVVSAAAFSPDSQRVVTASYDHTARIWSVANGRLIATLQGHTDKVWAAVFSPDGQRIATGSWDHTVRVWNGIDGRELVTLQGHTDIVYAAQFSPDGKRLVSASYDHTARVWKVDDGHLLATLHHEGGVSRAQFSPDGRFILTASWDNTARIWNANDGALTATLRHDGPVRDAEFSSDGLHIVTASYDRTARVWNAANGRLLATLQGHSAPIYSASFAPYGRRIVTASRDHTARVTNTANGRLLATLQGHTDAVYTPTFSPDGRRIVTASYDGTARIWNGTDGSPLATLQGHTAPVWVASFSPNGHYIATASLDHTARIWNATDGRQLAVLQGHTQPVYAAAFSPDGEHIVTASADRTARVWNVADGRLLTILEGHTDWILSAVFSPDGQRIVTAGYDSTARLWSAADGRSLAVLRGHSDKVWSVAFSSDGQRIITTSSDRTARIWNTADGRLLTILRGHTDRVAAGVFSPDGRRIVTASYDGTARIWNSADGRLVAILEGHTDAVRHAEFSPDGRQIITASNDHTARVWNTSDGRLRATLQGHTETVFHAAFSPDGQRVITSSIDRTARVWEVLTLEDMERILKQ